ncbi:C2 domain-containing protein 2 [Pelodytes ibericus]
MPWFGGAQWFVLVSMFVAAVVTLAVYLFQYILNSFSARKERFAFSNAQSEASSLLSWILSLNSWKSQWLKAWITALNEEAGKRGGSLRLAFEDEDGQEPLNLSVKEVSSIVNSEKVKVVSCTVVGDSIQFGVRVTRTIPANSGCQVYNVRVTPLHLNLELCVKQDQAGNIRISWSMGSFSGLDLQVQPKTKQEGPGASAIVETLEDILKNLMGLVRPSVELSTRPTEARDLQSIGGNSQVICPPKPPRAHDLKLQVKNIKATLSDGTSLSGAPSVVCTAQLNDPAQKVTTAAINNTTNLSWDEEFSFELNAKSKELLLHIQETGKAAEGSALAWAAVPLDLFRKQPSGWQSSQLVCRPGSGVSGSITAQFLYVEPNEVKCWIIPAPIPAKKVEKDRTVMPCGTVVTTVTSVTSKPRVEGKGSAVSQGEETHNSPAKLSPKMKVIERDFSVQAIPSQNAVVSKALSSSDTELLMLNGSDPVAEVAIRQLRESSKQSLKSPRKKSTIIISGISKTALTQDDETTLMFDYAAAMDSSTANDLHSFCAGEAPAASGGLQVPATPDPSPEEELHDTWGNGSQYEDWASNGVVEQDSEEISVSNLSISETGSAKKSKGGFLQKGAKLFFRRRHHQKDPGMSQSHNDLVYLQQPGSEERHKKGATLARLLNKKMISKYKSKNKGQYLPAEAPEN